MKIKGRISAANFRRTKLIVSLGPASDSIEGIQKLQFIGADVARLNFSHGSDAEHLPKVEAVREATRLTNIPMSLLLDTKGPEIRTHKFIDGEAEVVDGSTVEVFLQEKILGDANKFSISYRDLHKDVSVGGKILVDDGYLELEIKKISKEKITTVALNTHVVADRRGINIPGVAISIDFLSDKDIEDIEFGCDQNFDYIALSFVQRAEDVRSVREILKRKGGEYIQLISKLESQGAVDNFREILNESDGIMIARGDLGVEVDPTIVPTLQKRWIREANKVGKPVIVATQMLESMTYNPKPTRAEVSDVYNAIEDATSAIMLSGESAKGKYFTQAATFMRSISISSEANFDSLRYFNRINRDGDITKYDDVAKKAFMATFGSTADHIFILNPNKEIIKIIARSKPYAKIIPILTKERYLTRWNLYFGVFPAYTPEKLSFGNEEKVMEFIKNYGLQTSSRAIVIEENDIQEVTIK